MKRNIYIVTVLLLGLVLFMQTHDASAQCAMCTLNAENSVDNGNTFGMGLNRGILFLLVMPFILLAGIFLLWYKKFRKNPKTEAQISVGN
ncbi:MAG TPA: hypothetical protein VK102_09190 [Sphingobacterium sp.]|nr:hypothetical protein [Sphingobacterium sp.]